ncbi:hypothetical protein MIR68_007135 [Amoeboaphelidium protococcarum]|nr:hypothetical protein MIR68_007135 [Amoeboaphelidium protococcarum]
MSKLQSIKQLRFNSTSSGGGVDAPFYKKTWFWGGVLLVGVGAVFTKYLFSGKRSPLGGNGKKLLSQSAADAQPQQQYAINPKEFTPLTLEKVEPVNYNTNLYRFKFDNPEQTLGLNVASCLLVKADCAVKKDDGTVKIESTIRPYTPVSERHVKGHVDLVVKTYENGVMSKHLSLMKPGDTLLFKGPLGKIKYEENKWKHLGFLMGGSGLTPALQIIREILGNPADKTKVTLIFANQSQRDILLKDELDQLAKQHPNQFKLFYTVDKAEDGWKGFVGYIDEKKLKKANMPKVSEKDSMVLVCGPPGFMKVMSGDKNPDKSQGEVDPNSLLGKLGFTKDNVYKF